MVFPRNPTKRIGPKYAVVLEVPEAARRRRFRGFIVAFSTTSPEFQRGQLAQVPLLRDYGHVNQKSHINLDDMIEVPFQLIDHLGRPVTKFGHLEDVDNVRLAQVAPNATETPETLMIRANASAFVGWRALKATP